MAVKELPRSSPLRTEVPPRKGLFDSWTGKKAPSYMVVILGLIIIVICSLAFYRGNALFVIFMVLLVTVGRSNLLYHTMNMEVHSVLVLAMAAVHGPLTGAYIAIMSTLLAFKTTYWIGLVSPGLTIMDMFLLFFIGFFGGFIPQPYLFYIGFPLLVVLDLTRNTIKFFTLHESPIKYLAMSAIYIVITYVVMSGKMLAKILAWLA